MERLKYKRNQYKISQFRKNLRLRNRGTLDMTSSFKEGREPQEQSGAHDGGKYLCENCSSQGSLVNHLLSEEACLIAYLRRHLPHRVHMYKGRPKLSVFDLGIVGRFCPNPNCEGDLEREGVIRHVGSPVRYILKIHFFIEFGLKMIQFKIQFKTKSKMFIQKNIHSKQNPKYSFKKIFIQ